MRRAIEACSAGAWPAERTAGAVTLTFDDRHRRRLRLADDKGEEFLLDLPVATVLNDGDGLRLDDGTWLAVRAAPEDVCDITCGRRQDLARVAWHLGNRHLPVQVLPEGLRIRHDHVIVEMVRGLGATVVCRQAPFAPEPGAYASQHAHEHEHG